MSHVPSLSTASPYELAKFTFRAFESGDGVGLAAVTHPTALGSLHRRIIEVMAGHLKMDRQRRDLEKVSSGGLAVVDIGDLDMLELRAERLANIPGIETFGQLLDLDAPEFFARMIRAQTELLTPERPEDRDPVSSFEVGEEVAIDGEWASVPFRRIDRYALGHVRTKDHVLRARLDGSRWLVWSVPDLPVNWSLFLQSNS